MRIVAALLLVAACTRPLPPEPHAVIVDSDSKAQCHAACERARAVGCPEGNPSPQGASCESVCAEAFDLLPVACVARASTKADVLACGIRCRP